MVIMTPKCLTCELTLQRDNGTAPLWDNIYRTDYWDVVHCNSTSYLGWLILLTRRHIAAIDEMTADESLEFGVLMQQVSQVLKQHTGCVKTYVIQFAESPNHQHVHFHIVPRMADQAPDDIALGMFKHLGVSEDKRVSEDEMNAFATKIQTSLYALRK